MTDSVKDMLRKMKQEQEQEFENNVISGTIVKLLEIEKQSLYGSLRNKKTPQESIIEEGLRRYREEKNADS